MPWADFNLLKLPAGTGHESDFTMLSDIFPTGYHGTELVSVSPGDTVAVFGAGPVGLMAAHSAALRGAAQVFVVDKEPGRLALAEHYGATAVNFTDADPVQAITDATDGAGVDCGVEAVGYQAHDASGQEHPEMVLDKLVEVVRATGRIGVVGVYNPQDPGAATEDARQGRYGFNYGLVFDKAITMGHGQCPVKRYNHQLRDGGLTMFWSKLGYGVAAGAAGVTTLNVITYLDMAVRARPASDTPSQAVEQLTRKAGAEIPGQGDDRANRLAGLGPLAGIVTGALAMAGSDGPLVALSLTRPDKWAAADWASDIVPHLGYGAAVYATLTALDTDT